MQRSYLRDRAKRDVGYNAKMKKAVEPGISMPLSTRHGDGRRLILRTSAPSGATDKNPGVGAYTPRRDTKGNVPMCTEIRAVLWGKPQREKTLEEKIEAGDWTEQEDSYIYHLLIACCEGDSADALDDCPEDSGWVCYLRLEALYHPQRAQPRVALLNTDTPLGRAPPWPRV